MGSDGCDTARYEVNSLPRRISRPLMYGAWLDPTIEEYSWFSMTISTTGAPPEAAGEADGQEPTSHGIASTRSAGGIRDATCEDDMADTILPRRSFSLP